MLMSFPRRRESIDFRIGSPSELVHQSPMRKAARPRKPPMQSFEAIAAAVEAEGLSNRGAFHVGENDAVPPFDDATPAATLVLVGNAGSRMWPVFAASEEANDGAPNALDRWSRRVVSRLADMPRGRRALSLWRTALAAVHPVGAAGRAPCTPRPSGRWCTRTSACGMPTGVRSRFANVSISRPATLVRVPVKAASNVPACRRVRSARSP